MVWSWWRSRRRWQWGHVLISIFVWPVSTGISGINWISVWTSFFILKKVHQDFKKYERFICSISRRTISKFCEGKKKNINGLKCFKMSTWILFNSWVRIIKSYYKYIGKIICISPYNHIIIDTNNTGFLKGIETNPSSWVCFQKYFQFFSSIKWL